MSTGRQPLASVPSNLFGNPTLVTPDQKAHTPTGNANDVIVLTAVKLLSSFTFLHHQLANVFFVPPTMQGPKRN